MSVPKGKRKKEANPIIAQSRDLYIHLLKLVGDQNILDRKYRPSLVKSITSQAQSIMHCIALADSMSLTGKYARSRQRLNAQLMAADGIPMLVADLHCLYNIGTIGEERIATALSKVIDLDRSLKAWVQEDRMQYDKLLHTVSNNEIGYDDNLSTSEAVFPENVIKKPSVDFSDIYRSALERVPERKGIVNNPTHPNSPVIDEVRARQSHEKDDASCEDIDILASTLSNNKVYQKDID